MRGARAGAAVGPEGPGRPLGAAVSEERQWGRGALRTGRLEGLPLLGDPGSL